MDETIPSRTYTPTMIKSIISKHHASCNYKPSKLFIRQHCLAIENLPITQYQRYCSTTFHVDGGANCGGVNDKRLLYFYIESQSNIEQVGGDHVHSPGWGGILVQNGTTVNLLCPVYYCPNSPRNTLSTTTMIQYCSYSNATVHTNKHLEFSDSRKISKIIPFEVHNDLDHATLNVMCFNNHLSLSNIPGDTTPHDDSDTTDNIIAAAQHNVRRSPRLLLLNQVPEKTDPLPVDCEKLPCPSAKSPPPPITDRKRYILPSQIDTSTHFNIYENDEKIATLPRSTVSLIAAYLVHLSNPSSPRQVTIRNMNSLLGNHFNSNEQMHRLNPGTPQLLETSSLVPVIANFSRNSIPDNNQLYAWAHLHFSMLHTSQSSMEPIIKRKLLTDIPSILKDSHKINCTCFICKACKTDKRKRGKLVSKSHLLPFQRLHFDFSFFGVTSIRGFTSALDVTCGSTSYGFGFPCKSKTPPLSIVKWVILTLKSMGFTVLFIRVDEDGSLANSSEFCTLVQSLNCLLETTGGGNSTNNGMVERGNRTRANMIRSMLSTMNMLFGEHLPKDVLIDQFWCFAYQHACFTQRRLYNRMRDEIPYFLVNGKRPSAKELIIPGSLMTIVDPNKHLKPKLDLTRTTQGYFLTYSNHCSIRLYFDPKHPTKIKRSTHCIIDDIGTMSKLMSAIGSPSISSPISDDNPISKYIVDKASVTVSDDPFPGEEIKHFTFDLPPFPTPIGLTIADDLAFNIPYIKHCVPGSIIHNILPPGTR